MLNNILPLVVINVHTDIFYFQDRRITLGYSVVVCSSISWEKHFFDKEQLLCKLM